MKSTPEDIRAYLADHPEKSASLREIIRHFAIPEADRPAFRRTVKRLAGEGFLVRARGGRYAAPEALNLVTGRLQAHPDGYAFVVPAPAKPTGEGEAAPDGVSLVREGEDVFIPPGARAGALHGDRVAARRKQGMRGKWEGEIVRIEERGAGEIVGRIDGAGGRRWFVPLDPRFGERAVIARDGDHPDARKGMLAVLQIDPDPTRRVPGRGGERGRGGGRTRRPVPGATGKIVRVLGYPDDPRVEVDMICAEFGLRTDFPEEALREAASLHEPDAAEARKREDLRNLLTVTIDGETAKDFDDAVSLETLPGGVRRLGVHIADVSSYTAEGGALDTEARLRGTSVYFPGAAIPMLPPGLSENLCSLLPNRDRLTLTAFLDYDRQGRRTGIRLADTIIHSRARLTYAGVSSFLDGETAAGPPEDAPPPDVTPPEGYEEVPGLEKTLRKMARLARQLRSRRLNEGGLDLDIPEPEVVVDAEGRVTRIRRAPRHFSQQIIEEFMLAANRSVAERLAGTDPPRPDAEDGDRPGMFRVHEPPDPDKLKEVALLLRNLHHQTPGLSSGDPRALGRVLTAARGGAEEAFVNMAVLRAMKLARYDPANLGHFGLGFAHYTHFTSPIRRHPDLIVHRLIRADGLTGRRKMGRRRLQSLEGRMHTLAGEASRLERAAESAERAMLDYKRVQFMRDLVGETFEGKVSGIVRTGFFVTLNEHFVDGFVRLADLGDDYYVFEEENYRLLGRRTRRAINLGDEVTVRVDRANLDTRRIDFSLSGPEASGGAPETAGRRGRKTSPPHPPSPSPRSGQPRREGGKTLKAEGRRSTPRKRGGTTRKAGRKSGRR